MRLGHIKDILWTCFTKMCPKSVRPHIVHQHRGGLRFAAQNAFRRAKDLIDDSGGLTRQALFWTDGRGWPFGDRGDGAKTKISTRRL